MSLSTQLFVIGMVVLGFALAEILSKGENFAFDTSINDIIRVRYQMITGLFFIIGSMFFIG